MLERNGDNKTKSNEHADMFPSTLHSDVTAEPEEGRCSTEIIFLIFCFIESLSLSFFSVLHWVGAKWGWGQPLIYLTKEWREGADGCQREEERHSKTDDLELHSEMFQVIVTSRTIHILSAPINYSLQRAAEQELWAWRSVRRTINDDLLGSWNKTSDDHWLTLITTEICVCGREAGGSSIQLPFSAGLRWFYQTPYWSDVRNKKIFSFTPF